MNRSISVMVGKGSINHNSRKFYAENVDKTRTPDNITFINENLDQVYRSLFGKALEKYNEKQTRNDRRITNYYDKIRTGKQEKLFHEVIFQIGNKDDMNARTYDGDIAKEILVKFISEFEKRNQHLKVFSAYLHMDEETPHLHIDFVPFTTGSKRGLETRVSLKKALLQQGFKGGSRSETEWNQWVSSEKNELSKVMERFGVYWKQLDTQKPHLSVLDYKKQEREKEVIALEDEVEALHSDIEYFTTNVAEYDIDKKWEAPLPQGLMSASKYREKIVNPFVTKLKNVIKTVVQSYVKLSQKYRALENSADALKTENRVIGKMVGTAIRDYKAVVKELEQRTGKRKMRETDYMEIARDMSKER